MSSASELSDARRPSSRLVVPALGIVQILMWGSTYYLLAILAPAIVSDTGWPFAWVIGGVSLGLLVAGAISPRVGRVIDVHGGRPVLVFSSGVTALGLAALGLSPNLPVYLLSWLLIGVGMGTGLYDAVFAALGRLYGQEARSAITNLTLFGGFASTICWPLSAYMLAQWDWRGACLAYAAIHLVAGLPIQALIFPAARRDPGSPSSSAAKPGRSAPIRLAGRERAMFLLLAGLQTIAQTIGSIIIVHLLLLLEARGLTLAAAVAVGTLFGPSQVGARMIERVFGARYHPIWTMLAATTLMAIGLALLLLDLPLLSRPVSIAGHEYIPSAALAVIIYGAGYGVTWIARGTLPLALFGAERYPVLIGRLALPSLLAQALSPFFGALLIDKAGAPATVAMLTVLALFNVLLALWLWWDARTEDAAV